MSDESECDTEEMLAVSTPIDHKGTRMTAQRLDDGGIRFRRCAPLVDGQPIGADAEIFKLHRRGDGVWEKRTYRSGPARVNSPAYRGNWDSIFGKQPIAEA